MAFLRGIVCLVNFLLYLIGFCISVVFTFKDEKTVAVLGYVMLGIAFVMSLIISRFYPQGKRIKCAAFFPLNGLIIFGYLSIIFLLPMRYLNRILMGMNFDFADWKNGIIWDQSEERLSKKIHVMDVPIPSVQENGSAVSTESDPEILRNPGTSDTYHMTSGVWDNGQKYVVDANGNHIPVRKNDYGRYIDDNGNEYI